MKSTLMTLGKSLLADRQLLSLLLFVVLFSLAFCIYVSLNVHPTELPVVTHYSSYGTTHFYRDNKWYYLLSFVVFGLINAVLYVAITCKIFIHKGRALALPFAWTGVVVVVLAFAVVYQVLKIAALS